jgi:hypothetical protein
MDIDFAGLEEASKKGNIVYKNKIKNAEVEIKKECDDLKKIFVSIMNTNVKEELEKGKQSFNFEVPLPFHAKNLEMKKEGQSVLFLNEECDNFNSSYLKEIEKKIDANLTSPYYSVNFKKMYFHVYKK